MIHIPELIDEAAARFNVALKPNERDYLICYFVYFYSQFEQGASKDPIRSRLSQHLIEIINLTPDTASEWVEFVFHNNFKKWRDAS